MPNAGLEWLGLVINLLNFNIMFNFKLRVHAFLIVLMSFTISCSEEEIFPNDNQVEFKRKSEVISQKDFELLKNSALNKFNKKDYTKIIKPDINEIKYQIIKDKLNSSNKEFSNNFDPVEYEEILGKEYDREYFQQLSNLFEFSKDVLNSDYFDNSSKIEDRQIYLEEVITYVILNYSNYKVAKFSSGNCSENFNICSDQAERDHGIRIGSCTGGAVILGLLTGGAGAATWPLCMATSGYLYDSAMTACHQGYQACINQ